jgi:hypothetical protein
MIQKISLIIYQLVKLMSLFLIYSDPPQQVVIEDDSHSSTPFLHPLFGHEPHIIPQTKKKSFLFTFLPLIKLYKYQPNKNERANNNARQNSNEQQILKHHVTSLLATGSISPTVAL